MKTSFKKPSALISALLLAMFVTVPVLAVAPAPGAFERTWARTDKPVADGVLARTWIWGPEANTGVLQEPYVQSPGGERDVQYYDKSRMEINNPNAVDDGLWYVTNGLLVVELMTGMMQVGDFEFEERFPAEINIVGDPGYAETPTYADYADLRDNPAFPAGSVITATIDGDGNIGDDTDLGQWNVTADELTLITGHRTASVFWEFMNSSGIVYEDGNFVNDDLFLNPYYATGYPITEAYWSLVMLAGSEQWVLTQAFERRVLTYAPNNNEGFQVEAGNVGLHYYQWRYETQEPVVEIDLQPERAVNPVQFHREQDIPIIAQALYDAVADDRFGSVAEIEAHLEQFVEHERLSLSYAIYAWIEAGIEPPDPDNVRLETEVESWLFGGPTAVQDAMGDIANVGIELDGDFIGGFSVRGGLDLVVILEAAVDEGLITEDQYTAALEFAAAGTGFHEVTAEVTINGELATEGAVSFLVTDEHTGEVLVDWALEGIEIEDGASTFTYWALPGGIDTITATVIGTDVEATATKAWTRGGIILAVQPADEPGS